MDIKPFAYQILVKPIEQKEILSNGKSLCQYGTVTAIGDEVKHIKVGDVIAYTIWGLNHIEYNGEKYYFVIEDPRFILGTFTLSQ